MPILAIPLGDFEQCPNCGHLGAEHSGGVNAPMECDVEGCDCVLPISSGVTNG